MEEEEVAADTTSSLTIKGRTGKVKRHHFQLGRGLERGEFGELVVVAWMAR